MHFEACAESYELHAAPQLAFAARLAEFIELTPSEPVLEFGAGTGALTRHLCRPQSGPIHATDLSPAMVRQGQRTVPSARWSVLDAFGGPLPAATLQVSSGLLQWAEDPLRVLRQWKDALAPGGRMVHAFPCEPCFEEWRALVPENPVCWRDQAAWRHIFAQAGLHIRRTALWVERTQAPSALDWLRTLHRSGVTSRPQLGPGRLRQALRRYQELHGTEAGVRATWAWLAVEASSSLTPGSF